MKPANVLRLQLEPEQLTLIRDLVQSVVPGASVAVFGSRATGRARPFSDVDLLITRPATLTWQQRVDLHDAFEASTLPFRVDLVEAGRLASAYAARVKRESVTL